MNSMHIATVSNKKVKNTYISKYLRHTCRDKNGQVQKTTLATLSSLPDSITDVMSSMLKNKPVVDPEEHLNIIDVKIHGPVKAYHIAWKRLDIQGLLGGDKENKHQKIISALIGAKDIICWL